MPETSVLFEISASKAKKGDWDKPGDQLKSSRLLFFWQSKIQLSRYNIQEHQTEWFLKRDSSHLRTKEKESWWSFPLRLCNTTTPAYLSLRWLSTFVINCLGCLYFSPSLSFLVTLHLLLCASPFQTSIFPIGDSQFCLKIRGVNCDVVASGQVAALVFRGVGCVCVRACPLLRGARPHFNPGFSGGAAPDGAIVLRHASIIHGEPEKVAECVCLLNN